MQSEEGSAGEIALTAPEWFIRLLPTLRYHYRSMVGVFRRGADGKFAVFGSGILVEYRGTAFVATCAHNLDEEDPETLCLWLDSDQTTREVLEGDSLRDVCDPKVDVRFWRDDSAGIDMGLIRIRNRGPFLAENMRFYKIDETGWPEQDWRPGEVTAVIGFPGCWVKTTEATVTPSGILLPGVASIQQITLLPILCFESGKMANVWFEVPADRYMLSEQDDKPNMDYRGFSGGPVFKLRRAGLHGDPSGFVLMGLVFAQTKSRDPLKGANLKCNYIDRWCQWVDQMEGEQLPLSQKRRLRD